MIKMMAFDFDGTIADTIPMCIEALKKLGVENYFSDIMVGDEIRFNKAESILKLLKNYIFTK